MFCLILDEKMRKAFKIVTDQSIALRNWQKIAEALGLSQDNITEIETNFTGTLREQCRQSLILWKNMKGKRATRKVLSRILKNLKIMDAAGKFATGITMETSIHSESIEHEE